MLAHKRMRERGKLPFTRYFQVFKEGDTVAVFQELALPFGYPKKIQGRTGKVLAKRGAAYYVEIKDLNKPKRYLIHPVHLKRIKN